MLEPKESPHTRYKKLTEPREQPREPGNRGEGCQRSSVVAYPQVSEEGMAAPLTLQRSEDGEAPVEANLHNERLATHSASTRKAQKTFTSRDADESCSREHRVSTLLSPIRTCTETQ